MSKLCLLMMMISLAPCLCGVLAQASPSWQERVLAVPYRPMEPATQASLQLLRQDYCNLEFSKSVIGTPLNIGSQPFTRGLGTHSVSHIRVTSPSPISRFTASVGVDNNYNTGGKNGSVEFVVLADGQQIFRSEVLRCGQASVRVDVDAKGATVLDLQVTDGGDGPSYDHADWAEAAIITSAGTKWLDELPLGAASATRYPFSFNYNGKSSDVILDGMGRYDRDDKLDANRTEHTTMWTDCDTKLRITWKAIRYSDFPAVDWVLYFENTGSQPTPIIDDIQALSMGFNSPLAGAAPYRLHRTNGAPSNPTDFQPSIEAVAGTNRPTLAAAGGRSSNGDFPFFKVEMEGGSVITAVGWSGQWRARLQAQDNANLLITAGQELTHFKLMPGEKVRTPRMLVMNWQGDTLESNAQFRQLIYKYYAAKLGGKSPMPTPFCNTCFTRGGMWLNETTEQNQISLINAYSALGLEALMTDAGWFVGGWPMGAGNWTPRPDNYPNGMAPVAAAAKAKGMIYGLWFEPERVISGTDVHRNHPAWCLQSGPDPQETMLLNFGLPEVQDYFFNIVKGFMDLPGFKVYRQDFNMDPLQYWRYNDAPDRQGITEIKYIEGLYAYWDRLASTYPDSFREECASGGRRIDLETIIRMHAHQDSDYWFDNDTDQGQNWGVSQYLPNNTIVQHLNRLDDYSFHSTLASSLCLGWIADDPAFDTPRGKQLLGRYLQIRHLLIGAWYPLLPYTRDANKWMASQYHRPDLNEGLIIALRHAESAYTEMDVTMHGLTAAATYELIYDSTGTKKTFTGAQLMAGLKLTIANPGKSELIHYKKL